MQINWINPNTGVATSAVCASSSENPMHAKEKCTNLALLLQNPNVQSIKHLPVDSHDELLAAVATKLESSLSCSIRTHGKQWRSLWMMVLSSILAFPTSAARRLMTCWAMHASSPQYCKLKCTLTSETSKWWTTVRPRQASNISLAIEVSILAWSTNCFACTFVIALSQKAVAGCYALLLNDRIASCYLQICFQQIHMATCEVTTASSNPEVIAIKQAKCSLLTSLHWSNLCLARLENTIWSSCSIQLKVPC